MEWYNEFTDITLGGFTMKKAKMLGLVLALTIVLQVFTVCPATAETGLTIDVLPGQVDEVEYDELDRYPDRIPTEIISEEQIQLRGHTRRLPQAEGDMQTVMVGNEDGTNSLYVFPYPVKYTDSEGRIRDKSNRLSAHEVEAYAYVNTENDIQTHLPEDITQDPVTLTYGEYAICSMPVTEMTSSLAQKRDGGAVVYPSAFGLGTALCYQVDFSGYKEDIIIEREGAPTEFSFYMYCVGLEPIIQDGMIVYADSASGETVFTTSPFYIYDSSEETNGYTDTDFTLTKVNSSVYQLTVDVDEVFLETEGLTYPVCVDPSLTFASTSQVETVTVYKNLTTASPSDETYGYVGFRDSSYGEARMLLRFTGLRDNIIYRTLREDQINNVTMYLMTAGYGESSSTIRAAQFMGDADWDDESTWNSIGMTNSGTVQSQISVAPTSGTVSINITKAAQTWLGYSNNANNLINAGIMLRCSNVNNQNYCRSFYTENAGPATAPYVVVDFTPVIENGTYFVVNQETNHSLQSMGSTNGTGVKANTYYGDTSCQWIFTMQSNGYFKICSVATGLYLSINSSDTSGAGQVTLNTSSSGRGAYWAVIPTNDGGYILMANPVAATNDGAITQVLALPSNSSSGGTVGQYAYVDDANEKDEWYIGFTTRLEPQETDVWCWVASARMVSMNYKISSVTQESAAVYGLLGVEEPNPTYAQRLTATSTANIETTASTLEYIIGDNVHYANNEIYDEITLRNLLDASTPVIIRRGRYSSDGERRAGHCVVVYNYYWDSSSGQYIFNIFDPWDVNEGSQYSLTYQAICKRAVPSSQDFYIWDGIVVVAEGDYLNTIEWIGN